MDPSQVEVIRNLPFSISLLLFVPASLAAKFHPDGGRTASSSTKPTGQQPHHHLRNQKYFPQYSNNSNKNPRGWL